VGASKKNFSRAICLGAVSYLALSIDFVREVKAQAALPTMTVIAPKPRQARHVVRTTPRAVSRSQRAAPQRVEPVRYATPSTGTLGSPAAPYAGGQVATGGQLGFLGNRGVMNTPFNQTSYTAELIQNQQARTVGDVMANDPSVRVVSTAGGGQDVYFIRGYYYDPGDLGLNGLYGIPPYYSVMPNFVERVEVLKGPSALLSGMPPAGAVGGSINLVTKKAPDFDITQLTATYASRSQFGTLVDVARRYGEQKEWGVRFNGGYRNGSTPFDRQNDEYGNAVLGLDYRGERVRVSADIGYQIDNLSPPIRFLQFLPTIAIPPAPAAGTNFIVPWAKWRTKDSFAVVRSEVDVTDWATVYGAVGYHDSRIDFRYPSPTVINTAGDYQSRPFDGDSEFRTLSGEVGVRANVDTGPVNHALSINYSATDRPNDNRFSTGSTITSNIYNPLFVPEQTQFALGLRNRQTTKLSSVGVADTLSILDKRVQLTVGVRRQSVGQSTFNNLTGVTSGVYDASVWSPAYALVVKPVSNLSLYANYIEGLKAGTVVGAGFSNAGQTFAPFQTKQVETGFKVDLGRLTTTVSLFQITQPSVLGVAGLPLPSQQLAGEQRNRGAEFSVFGEVTPDLRLLGGVAFIDGRLTKTAGGLTDGNKAPGVGNVQLNLGAEYDLPFARGVTVTGRVIYTSEQFADAANTQILPDWTRVDLGARYTFTSPWNGKPIVVRAAIENVANLSYYSSAYNGVVALGAPRTYLVSATFNF
jgi:iron complex outermembrane receptor protein